MNRQDRWHQEFDRSERKQRVMEDLYAEYPAETDADFVEKKKMRQMARSDMDAME